MRIDLDRHVPLGMDGENEARWYLQGLGAACIWSLMWFISSYSEAYRNLFHYVGLNRSILREGARIDSFAVIIAGSELLFLLLAAVMPLWAVYHYRYHHSPTHSVYLMKRLPDRMEYHRRCLTMPVCGLVAALALQGVLGCVYYLIYIFVTPRQCLPL